MLAWVEDISFERGVKHCEMITAPAVRYVRPARCQNHASYRIDGKPMCVRHAQKYVFERVMEIQAASIPTPEQCNG